jgi:hypothetical protein
MVWSEGIDHTTRYGKGKTMESIATAIGFGVLAIAHSALGERELLRPLFAREWDIGIPRVAVERILRFAWHITSVAWLGLAALALGASAWLVLAAVAFVSGLVIFVSLRGHLAWPIFFGTALAAGVTGGLVGTGLLAGVSLTAALALAVAGLLHVRWAAGGGQRLLAAVVPTGAGGRPLIAPPWWVSLGVAVALLFASAAIVARTLGWAVPGVGVALVIVTIVFALRAVGDGRHVGFSKKDRSSMFARLDDRVYTPLSVLFSFGGAAALLL